MIYFAFSLLLVCTSAKARVAITDEKLPEITDNLIRDQSKPADPVIRIDLPIITNTHQNEVTDNTATDNANIRAKVADTLETDHRANKTCSIDIFDNLINSDEADCVLPKTVIDNGTALILTQYIEENKLFEARNASRVDPQLFLGVESHSGFVTVDENHDSNVFFWYFPIEKKPVQDSPWIIWLQGGPGASSMTGLFDEIGPFTVDSDRLVRNPYSWLQNHSLVFIDNPVGTGYSYTNHPDGFVRDMDMYGAHLYSALKQIVTIFPELRKAPLYIAGESYAGKYIPALAVQIHRHKAQEDINLKGLMVGNGYIDPATLSNMVRPFYYFGMLGTKQIADVQPLLNAFQQDIANHRSDAAKEKWTHLITIVLLLTHQKHAYNFLRDDLPVGRYSGPLQAAYFYAEIHSRRNCLDYLNFLRRAEIKKALHVGDIRFSFVNVTVNARLTGDFLSNAKPLYEELLDHYRVLVYCGQLDQMLPCVFSSENYRTWKWSASNDFLNSTRFPYIYNGRLAGYQKEGGGLTEAMIRGAGHMVPLDSPAATRHLIARWVKGLPLSQRFGLLEGSFVQEFVRNTTLLDTENNIYL